MTKKELNPGEYNSYYQLYIDKIGDVNIWEFLKTNHESVISFIKGIDESKFDYRYAEGKWSIKEVVLHLIDTERVFAYRALRIARKDKTELSGFDQNAYAVHGHADERNICDLLSEYKNVRLATISLFESFDEIALTEIGVVSNSPLSVRAVAFIIVGHEDHHLQIIKERYL